VQFETRRTPRSLPRAKMRLQLKMQLRTSRIKAILSTEKKSPLLGGGGLYTYIYIYIYTAHKNKQNTFKSNIGI
jgi:hypothetical protein